MEEGDGRWPVSIRVAIIKINWVKKHSAFLLVWYIHAGRPKGSTRRGADEKETNQIWEMCVTPEMDLPE